jgi:HlyD family secretion protein
MKRILWGGAAVLVLILLVLSMRPQPIVVDIGMPERRSVQEYIAEEAKIRLRDEYLVDMPVSGTLRRISWEVGDVVDQGAVLAEVDTFDLEQRVAGLEYLIQQSRAQIGGVESGKPKSEDLNTAEVRAKEMRDALNIAEKELQIASIDFEEASRDYERAKRLKDQGVASQSMLDDAEQMFKSRREQVERGRLAVASARKNVEIAELSSSRVVASVDDNEYLREVYQAEIKRLESELAVAKSDLEKAVIKAPVCGPVLEKFIENTRVLVAGTPILKLGDLRTMEIESDVLSEEVVEVVPGDTVEIIGKALGDATITGTVDRIYPSAFKKISSLGIEQQRVKTIIAFDNTELNLRAGTRLDVRIIVDESKDTIAVPERSVFKRDDTWHVFVVKGGKAELRQVTLGLKNDTWAEIVDGLAVDEEIVLEPKNDLEPGSRVAAR